MNEGDSMFTVIHDGKVILQIEEQVNEACLRTSRGSGQPVFLSPSDGVVELVISKIAAGGPIRLDQIEAAQLQATQDRGVEGELVGTTPNTINADDIRKLLTPQSADGLVTFPAKDLAEGTETLEERNAAIEEFNANGNPTDDEPDDEPADDDEDAEQPVTV